VRAVRARCFLLSGLLIALSLPALAGESYVPFVTPEPPGTGTSPIRATFLSFDVINNGAVNRLAAIRFVALGEDGNAGGTTIFNARLPSSRPFPRICCQDSSGLLVLSGAPQIEIEVHLTEAFAQAEPNLISLRLPLLTARDARPAGSTARLETLHGDGLGFRVTSLGILNLARQPAHCSVAGFPPVVQQRFFGTITVPPISVAAYPDLFGRPSLGLEGAPTITCDQPFYPFAIAYVGFPGAPASSLPWAEFVPPVAMLGGTP
jgi:hypothetical protein